jgi:hypothetical protein
MVLKNSSESPCGAAVADSRRRATATQQARGAWSRFTAWWDARPPAMRLTVVTGASLGLWAAILFAIAASIG